MNYRLVIFLLFISGIAFSQVKSPESRISLKDNYHSGIFLRPLEDSRLHDYDVHFYHLEIEADNLSTDLVANTRVMASVINGPFNEFVLELTDALDVTSVIDLNTSNSLSFSHSSDLLVINLPAALSPGDYVDVRIYYEGTPPADAGFFKGISSETDPNFSRRVTWTLSEPYNAIDWWPTKQVLTDKADSAYIYLNVPDNLKAGAPGILAGVESLPNNRVLYKWETTHPIAYYLISMAISEYQDYSFDVSLPGQPVFPVVNYIYDHPNILSTFKDDIDETADMLALFSELFGPYPFNDEKYGHAMAPMGGGMEHQTMSTMSTFNFGLNAHELGHQWFGDHVTCETWSDIWINEGFARYCEYLAAENLISRTVADNWMQQIQTTVLSTPGGSVYVPENQLADPFRIFNGRLTYNKGGALLHMLRYLTDDDDLFFASMRDYLANYRDSVATGADFRDSFEQSSGLDLNNFFDEWYFGEGFPIYDIFWVHQNDSLVIDISQETSVPASVPLFTTPMPFRVNANGMDTTFRLVPSANVQQFKVYMPGTVNNLRFDPDGYLIKQVSSMVTDLEDPVSAGIEVFPNPAEEYMTVRIPGVSQASLSIHDIQGKTLFSEISTSQEIKIQTGLLQPGLYMLIIEAGGRKYRHKFFKK